MDSILGNFLDRTRKQHLIVWKLIFLLFLVAVVVANFYIHPHHAEFGLDAYPGFWALFGLCLTVLMIFVMKKVIQPMLVRPEETIDVD